MPRAKKAGKTGEGSTAPKKRRRKPAGASPEAKTASDTTAKEKLTQSPGTDAAVAALKAAINHKYGTGSIMDVTSDESMVARISTDNDELDRVLGGGWPKGRIIEIFGPESSGKTTLALQAVAAIQEATGGEAIFVDVEHALDPKYAEAVGVDLSRCSISQPDGGEQALDIVEMAVKSKVIPVVVLDSVAALVTKAELEGDIGDAHVGLQSRLMSQAMRKLTAAISKSDCIVIFINQIRDKVGVMGHGEKTTTSGGRALKFYASIRLDVRMVQKIKRGETFIGIETMVNCKKNKVAPPFKKATLDLYWPNAGGAVGICKYTALIDAGIEAGVITKSGGSHKFEGEVFGSSRLLARKALSEDRELFEDIRKALHDG